MGWERDDRTGTTPQSSLMVEKKRTFGLVCTAFFSLFFKWLALIVELERHFLYRDYSYLFRRI